MWKANHIFPNNKWFKKKISEHIRKSFEMNENEDKPNKCIIWAKAMSRGGIHMYNCLYEKEERF